VERLSVALFSAGGFRVREDPVAGRLAPLRGIDGAEASPPCFLWQPLEFAAATAGRATSVPVHLDDTTAPGAQQAQR